MGLHAVPRHHDGSVLYCGPAALVAVTGCLPAQAHAWLNDYRNKFHPRYTRKRRLTHKAVGTEHAEMVHALKGLGLTARVELFPPERRTTLARFARENPGTCIVEVSRHWVVLEHGWFVDSRHRKPGPSIPGPKRRVRSVIRVEVGEVSLSEAALALADGSAGALRGEAAFALADESAGVLREAAALALADGSAGALRGDATLALADRSAGAFRGKAAFRFPAEWSMTDWERIRSMEAKAPRPKRFALTCTTHGWEKPAFQRRPRTYKGWCRACAETWQKRNGRPFRSAQDYRGSLVAHPNVTLLDGQTGIAYEWVPGKGYVAEVKPAAPKDLFSALD